MQHHIIISLLFSAYSLHLICFQRCSSPFQGSLSKVHRTFFTLALCAMLLTSCGKDNKDNGTIIGKWANTAQSCEITIAGQENIPEGYICMEFTDSQVWVSDQRANCLQEWHGYTLSKESGKQLLEIEGGCHSGIFVVKELTSDKLVLAPETHDIDMDFHYIMKRN